MTADTGCIMDYTWREPCGEPTVSDVPGQPGYLWCAEHAEETHFPGNPACECDTCFDPAELPPFGNTGSDHA